jgi:dihydroneopterin aldolase
LTDTIVVRGIHAEGMHGLADERRRPQPFVVDIEVPGDLSAAAAADDISTTIDYGDISAAVRDVVMNESFELIEALAEAIAGRVKSLGASAVRVTVSKPRSAQILGVDQVAVKIER